MVHWNLENGGTWLFVLRSSFSLLPANEKLREGNVFTGVYHFVHWGSASLPQCNGLGMHPSHNAIGWGIHPGGEYKGVNKWGWI